MNVEICLMDWCERKAGTPPEVRPPSRSGMSRSNSAIICSTGTSRLGENSMLGCPRAVSCSSCGSAKGAGRFSSAGATSSSECAPRLRSLEEEKECSVAVARGAARLPPPSWLQQSSVSMEQCGAALLQSHCGGQPLVMEPFAWPSMPSRGSRCVSSCRGGPHEGTN